SSSATSPARRGRCGTQSTPPPGSLRRLRGHTCSSASSTGRTETASRQGANTAQRSAFSPATRTRSTRSRSSRPRAAGPPRRSRGGAALVPACAGAQPQLLAAVGARGAEVCTVNRFLLAVAAVAALALPATASAHPLGNFTVNRFSRIEVAGPHVYIQYALD